LGLMLDSTAAVAAERQGKNARQLLESVALETDDDEIAVSVVTVVELAHGIVRADTTERRDRRQRFLEEIPDRRSNPASDRPNCAPRRTDRWTEPGQRRPHPFVGSANRR
jgi:predicted nucleic acid-binding protein